MTTDTSTEPKITVLSARYVKLECGLKATLESGATIGWRCQTCSVSFSTLLDFERHSATHQAECARQCLHCGTQSVASLRSFAQHLDKHAHQPGPKLSADRKTPKPEPPLLTPFRCECGGRYQSAKGLHAHERCHERCDRQFCKHCHRLLIRRRPAAGSLRCQDCAAQFSQCAELAAHYQQEHAGPAPWRCERCLTVFSFVKAWARHRVLKHAPPEESQLVEITPELITLPDWTQPGK